MGTSEPFLYIEPPTISIASGLISCIRHRMVYPIQWVSLHPSDRRPTDVVSLHCPLWYSGSKSLLAFTSILCHAIVRLTILGRYYFNWSQWERAYLCSLVLRWEFFGHILVLSHVLVLSFFFSEILSQHHFLEMGALMSPLTLMAVIRTNWSNKASIIQQWQKRNINEREGMGNWKVWNSISDVIIFCSKARPCLVLLNQLPFVLCCCYIYLYVI